MCVLNNPLNLPEGTPSNWTGLCSEDAMLEKLAPTCVDRVQFLSTALQISGWGEEQDRITTPAFDSIIINFPASLAERFSLIDPIKILFETVIKRKYCTDATLIKIIKLSILSKEQFISNTRQCDSVADHCIKVLSQKYKVKLSNKLFYPTQNNIVLISQFVGSKNENDLNFFNKFNKEIPLKLEIEFFPKLLTDSDQIDEHLKKLIYVLNIQKEKNEIDENNLSNYLLQFLNLKIVRLSKFERIKLFNLNSSRLKILRSDELKEVFINHSNVFKKLVFVGFFPGIKKISLINLSSFNYFNISSGKRHLMSKHTHFKGLGHCLEELYLHNLPEYSSTLNLSGFEKLTHLSITSCSEIKNVNLTKCSRLLNHSLYKEEYLKERGNLSYLPKR